MRVLKIGELAREAGVGVETIRFYERRGLLREPPRRPSGYRQYRPTEVKRLRFIRRAKELGFSLAEILELLELNAEEPGSCGRIRRQLADKADVVDKRIRDLRRVRAALVELRSLCESTAGLGECPFLEALERQP